MHKWKLNVALRNNNTIAGIFNGPQTNSTEVINALFKNAGPETFFGFLDIKEKSNILVKHSEVVAVEIAPYNFAK